MNNLEKKILISRLLTRSGDQAWDFALPVTLVTLYPQSFSLIASIFLASKVGVFLLQPFVAGVIDRWQRLRVAAFGTTLQLLSVVVVALCLVVIVSSTAMPMTPKFQFPFYASVFGIILGSVGASLGANLMDIAIGNDWIPVAVAPENLARMNSRIKQMDLLTEVLSPVLAGLLLTLATPEFRLFGFWLVVTWNVLSFVPEYLILRGVFLGSKELQLLECPAISSMRTGVLKKTIDGWRGFVTHPAALAMVAYACLWLSALSPHGVLLTSFLKGGWNLSEASLGFFRGSGALFGLLATLFFLPVTKRFGLLRGSLFFILFQGMALLISLPFFHSQTAGGFVFLSLVLISRIGLYGFSMGEMEIRQRYVAEGQRGAVNGVASALTSFATLVLFGAGTLVASHDQFYWLVWLSTAAVLVGAVLFIYWLKRFSPLPDKY